jgi:hypothetical protein
MKKRNLRRIVKLLKKLDKDPSFQERFTMECYNSAYDGCNTAGCVIGHSVRLNPSLFYTDYAEWSENFTGLSCHSFEWGWCFSSAWEYIDNTVEGAISRIKALLEGTITSHPDYDKFDNSVFFIA